MDLKDYIDFKTSYKPRLTDTCSTGVEINKQINRTKSLELDPYEFGQLVFVQRQFHGERFVFTTNCARIIGCP